MENEIDDCYEVPDDEFYEDPQDFPERASSDENFVQVELPF